MLFSTNSATALSGLLCDSAMIRIAPALRSYTEQLEFQKIADEVVIAEHGVSQPLIEALTKVAGEPED